MCNGLNYLNFSYSTHWQCITHIQCSLTPPSLSDCTFSHICFYFSIYFVTSYVHIALFMLSTHHYVIGFVEKVVHFPTCRQSNHYYQSHFNLLCSLFIPFYILFNLVKGCDISKQRRLLLSLMPGLLKVFHPDQRLSLTVKAAVLRLCDSCTCSEQPKVDFDAQQTIFFFFVTFVLDVIMVLSKLAGKQSESLSKYFLGFVMCH